jgi:hypothetical protein
VKQSAQSFNLRNQRFRQKILQILIQTKKSPHSFNPQNQIGCRFSPSFGGEGEAKTSEYEHLIRGLE